MSQVTIGLPFKSEQKDHFMTAVRSVFAQTLKDWKLILVSDGAETELIEAAKQIEDPRVSLIEHKRSIGLAATLNEISNLATAELLIRMDADDIMYPERLATVTARLYSAPHVAVLASRLTMIDQDGVIRGLFREPPLSDERGAFLRGNALSHPAVAGRTSWFKANPYDPTFLRAEDKELWVRTADRGVFAKLEEPLMFYRVSNPLLVRKQGADSRWDRKVLLRYGPSQVGRSETARLIARSFGKQVAFRAMSALPIRNELYERKAEVLSPSDLLDAESALREVLGAEVPGWPASYVETRRELEE